MQQTKPKTTIENPDSLRTTETVSFQSRANTTEKTPPPQPSKSKVVILIAKMCISKYRYGQYFDLSLLFERELGLRNV